MGPLEKPDRDQVEFSKRMERQKLGQSLHQQISIGGCSKGAELLTLPGPGGAEIQLVLNGGDGFPALC